MRPWPFLRVAVTEQSMLPALRPGDWLLARRTRRIRPGQIVLAWHPSRPGFLLVKRAVRRVEGDGPGGTGGGSPPCGEEVGGGWWLESDNPAAGAVDSSRFGPVPEEKIVGRVLVRYWRPRRAGYRAQLSRTIPFLRPHGKGPAVSGGACYRLLRGKR